VTELGRALLDQLGPEDLADLAERLEPLLRTAERLPDCPVVYSPATLAVELGRSERSIRAAIARGELQAVKRGRGYVISAEEVANWAKAPARDVRERRHLAPSPSRRTGPGPARRALKS
jgi:excisionase family DNA binding protein